MKETNKSLHALSSEVYKYLKEKNVFCNNLGTFFLKKENRYQEIEQIVIEPNTIKKEISKYLLSKNISNVRLNLLNELYGFIQIVSSKNIEDY